MNEIMILIPAYNEEKNLPAVLQQLKALPYASRLDVVVVNDCSADGTARVARENGCTVISHVINMGYGMGLQTGYKYAVEHGYRYIIQMDADGQHAVSNVEYLMNRIQQGDLPDLMLGSRFLPGSAPYRMEPVRRATVRVFSTVIRWMTGKTVTDPTSGLQMLSRPLFLYYSGYLHFDPKYPDANMLIKILLKGFTVEEFPAMMTQRTSGTSMHSGLKPVFYMIQMAISMLIVSFRVNYEKKHGA